MENLRRLGLGGHDIAVICGVYPFESTPLDVYMEKVEGISNFKPNYIQQRGLMLEPLLLGAWLEENPKYNHPDYEIITNKRYTHASTPYFHAHPDAVIFYKGEPHKILEFKCVNRNNEWGEEGTSDVPDYIRVQTLWYQYVLDCQDCEIIVDDRYKAAIYYSQYKEEEVEFMASQGHNFWVNHINKRVPPMAINLNDIKTLYPRSVGSMLEGNINLYDKALLLDLVRSEQRELEKKERDLKFEIMQLLKENEGGMMNGSKFITAKEQVSNRVDTDALKEYPDIYESCLKPSSSRPIRTYFK